MSTNKPSSPSKFTQFGFGCFAWAIFPFVLLLLSGILLRNIGIYDTYKYTDKLAPIMFLIGIGLSILTIRKSSSRWIGVGIAVTLVFHIIVAIIPSNCMPPFWLPFPLSFMLGC